MSLTGSVDYTYHLYDSSLFGLFLLLFISNCDNNNIPEDRYGRVGEQLCETYRRQIPLHP